MEKIIIGNVRTGTRGEKDKPIKLPYFDVHLDNSTSSLAVEIFNEVYNHPKCLKIKFVNQNPLVIGFQKYEGKKLVCYGNGNKARRLEEQGKRTNIECNPSNCMYRKKGECKRVGRLYFVIKKLEDEGIWCYPMGSEKGIDNIKMRVDRANRIGKDLTADWYELYLKAENGIMGKNYIPDIRLSEEKKSQQVVDNNVTPAPMSYNKKQINNQKNLNYLKVISFEKAKYEDKIVPKIICINTSSEKKELILLPESKQDILKVLPESIIMPVSISSRNNFNILNDYKIVREITENKKVV